MRQSGGAPVGISLEEPATLFRREVGRYAKVSRQPTSKLNNQEELMASELFEKGLAVRKEVLGKEYVEKSIKGADEFSLAMQEFATEAAWGAIWTRPGL